MTLDPRDEVWLRPRLDALLTTEPPMDALLVEDVRRGETARAVVRRRRTAALAVAGLVLAVGAPSALLLRAAGSAADGSGGAATGSPTAGGTPTATEASNPTTVLEVLGAAGWQVASSATGDPQPVGATGLQTIYELRGPTGVTNVVVTAYAPGQATTDVLASCTASTCSPAYVGTSRVGAGGFHDDSRLVTDAPGLAAGSLVVDRAYDTGTTVEVGVGLVKPLPTTTPTAPRLALTPDQVLALLTVVGDPYAGASAQASLSASAAASEAAKAAAAADAERARRHPCRAADLTVALNGRDGAGGTLFAWYAYRNTSATACGLTGYPTLARRGAVAVPFTVRYGVAQGPLAPTPPKSPVLLEPGASALSLVSSYRCDVGEAGAVTDLVVTVPGDPTAIPLPSGRQPVCVGGPAAPGNEIDVSAFYRPTP